MKKTILMVMLLTVVIFSCSDDPVIKSDDFDRSAILNNWADNIIIPAHEAYNATTVTLKEKAELFTNEPTQSSLNELRTVWIESYKAWQKVPFFHLGRGDDIDVLISLYTNVYPVSTEYIDYFLTTGEEYNFKLSGTKAMQGFPALDYMLFGLAEEGDILSFYQNSSTAEMYNKYLMDVVDRIHTLSTAVYEDWNNGYRDEFVTKVGNSNESSVNKVVNDFIYSYEFDLRTSKVGLPSGSCIQCDDVLPSKTRIEGRFNENVSKTLMLEALDAAQNFYNGVPFNGSFEDRGTSLYDYLDYLDTKRGNEKICDLINTQFDKSREKINSLSDYIVSDFESEVAKMEAIHEELQVNVVNLKSYMMDAMNIGQDYVSSDGD